MTDRIFEARAITAEELARLFDADFCKIGTNEVGDLVAELTFRAVDRANFKEFFVAQWREDRTFGENIGEVQKALKRKESFQK